MWAIVDGLFDSVSWDLKCLSPYVDVGLSDWDLKCLPHMWMLSNLGFL